MSDHSSLAGLLRLVEESLDRPDTDGRALAERAHLSRFQFDRLARATLGEAPGSLRRRILLERAAYRLTATEDG